jgi:toxin CcdB
MAQYDVYAYKNGFLIDVQSDLLDQMNTRVVVPLLPIAEAPPQLTRLNPIFALNGVDYALVPQHMAAITLRELGSPDSNMSARHDHIRTALDMLFIGF